MEWRPFEYLTKEYKVLKFRVKEDEERLVALALSLSQETFPDEWWSHSLLQDSHVLLIEQMRKLMVQVEALKDRIYYYNYRSRPLLERWKRSRVIDAMKHTKANVKIICTGIELLVESLKHNRHILRELETLKQRSIFLNKLVDKRLVGFEFDSDDKWALKLGILFSEITQRLVEIKELLRRPILTVARLCEDMVSDGSKECILYRPSDLTYWVEEGVFFLKEIFKGRGRRTAEA